MHLIADQILHYEKHSFGHCWQTQGPRSYSESGFSPPAPPPPRAGPETSITIGRARAQVVERDGSKECNYNSIVIVHKHGGYDVTYKPRI